MDDKEPSLNEPIQIMDDVSTPPHSSIKPKGHPIPNIDYGLDIIKETESVAPPERSSPGSSGDASPVPDSMMDASEDYYDRQSEGSYEGSQQGFADPSKLNFVSEAENNRMKINLIAKYRRLKSKGYVPENNPEFTMKTPLKEMESIIEELEVQKSLDESIKSQREILMTFCNITETMSKSDFNVFDINLDGWSENVFENITDYDDVFEELHYKYGTLTSIPPELKLIAMIGKSAYMFHLTKGMFKRNGENIPDFNEVMSRDPQLKQRFKQQATRLAQERNMLPKGPQMNVPEDIDDLLGSLRVPNSKRDDDEDDVLDLSEVERFSDLV